MSQHVKRVSNRCPLVADKNIIYSGAFVSYVAFFETQLEDLFVRQLAGELVHPTSMATPVVQFPSQAVARDFVFSGRKYADWLPYKEHTQKRAQIYYSDDHPFNRLPPTLRTQLRNVSTLRNALAHNSRHSMGQFKKTFIDNQQIPVREQSPAQFLRGQSTRSLTRFDVHIATMVSAMDALCN